MEADIQISLSYVETCIQHIGGHHIRLLPTRSFDKIHLINKAVKFLTENNFVDTSTRGAYVKQKYQNLLGLRKGLEENFNTRLEIPLLEIKQSEFVKKEENLIAIPTANKNILKPNLKPVYRINIKVPNEESSADENTHLRAMDNEIERLTLIEQTFGSGNQSVELGWVKIFGASLPIPKGTIMLPSIKNQQQDSDTAMLIDLNESDSAKDDSCISKSEESVM